MPIQTHVFEYAGRTCRMKYDTEAAYPKFLVNGHRIPYSTVRDGSVKYACADFDWWRLAFRDWAETRYDED